MYGETISVTIAALEKSHSEAFSIQANDAHKMPDFSLLHIGAHNVYYVKCDMDIRE
jgi:hypothetical protein